jgi:hypothetical protein
MSQNSSTNKDENDLGNKLPDGVSVNQGVLTTPLGSWPISKISEVKCHVRPVWLTMFFAVAAGFVVTQLFVLAHSLDPKSLRANAIFTLTMLCVMGSGKVEIKVRTDGAVTTVWKESWAIFGKIHNDKGSAGRVHELISKALSTKVS